MDFQTLTVLYANKTDEELLELASQPEQLTLEAQSALRGEMGRRRLVFQKLSESFAQSASAESETLRPPDGPPLSLPVGRFIADTFGVYHQHLWLFIKLTAPAVFTGTVAYLAARHEVREVVHSVSWNSSTFGILLFLSSLISMAGWAVSWLAFSFTFASICAVARQITRSDDLSARTACRVVLSRFASFVRISLSLFLIFILLFGLAEVLTTTFIFRFLDSFIHQHPIVSFVLSFIAYGGIALIVSRFALAVPAVVLDGFKVGQSFFRSDQLTERKWTILAILLTKSILGGYVAGMLPFWLAGWLPVPEFIWARWWFSWVLTGASILAVSWVEPIMFIGFALLYEKTCGKESTAESQTDTRAAVFSS